MSHSNQQLADNYHRVLERIQRAAERANREPGDIQLVAVTKYVDSGLIRELHQLGCRDFGESRPQVLWKKAEELRELDLNWHLIGHLQTNKVRRSLPVVSLVHSGDSLKLLQLLDEESERIGQVSEVLCEVNISGDPAKHGFAPDRMGETLEEVSRLGNLRVRGLMAMASREGGLERARQDFERMQALRLEWSDPLPANVSLAELSMGMSGDFEEAILHGATLVRVGSVLFEGV